MNRRRVSVQHPCPGCTRPCWGRLCRACFAASKPPPQARRADLDSYAEKRRRRAAVAEWRQQYGDVCPGWNREPHRSERLTADHVQEVALGGDPRPDDYAILCVSCNSAKSNRRRAQARAAQRVFVDSSRDW